MRGRFDGDGAVTVTRLAERLGPLRSFAWQNARLGGELRRIGADVLVGFNHFVERVDCRQVVYHINLRRFSRDFRGGGVLSRAAESLRDRAAKRALTLADANVFESRYLQSCAETFHPGVGIANPSVVYNGLPEATFAAAVPDPPTLSPARLLTLTNPNPHKDCDTLVATLAELVRSRPGVEWRLDVAGGHDPSVWDGVRAKADALGVLDRIDFVGFCDAGRIAELTARSLCVVSTSRMESFQLVGVEGMARGCPCVVADCASMPESVGGAGLLASPGDASDFAEKIATLLNPAERLRRVRAGLEWTRRFGRDDCGRAFATVVSSAAGCESSALRRAA